MKILIMGAGKMVEAILDGLKNEADLSQFYIYSPSGDSSKKLAMQSGAHQVLNLNEVKEPDFVWLGCKPQQLTEASILLKDKFPKTTYVSMLAAISEADIRKTLNAHKVVRIMPNLPVKYKSGVTLISSSSAVAEAHQVVALFALLGEALLVKENELEELTLLTGSGPALFYEFTHYLASSFTSLDQAEREKLARMVLIGSSDSVHQSSLKLDELIQHVTSKGGVTIAVLEAWRNLKLKEQILTGIEMGKRRSQEIKDSLHHS